MRQRPKYGIIIVLYIETNFIYMKTQSQNNPKKGADSMNGHAEELQKLLKDQLRDVLSAEKQLVKALPKMVKASTSEELRDAFSEHLEVTKKQVERLEEVFDMLGSKAMARHCEAMEGLVKEAQEVIDDTEDGSLLRDVGLIIAAQKVEHYEIAAYGSLRSIANVLGQNEIADILQETLNEEGEADKLLTSISDNINVEAYEEATR